MCIVQVVCLMFIFIEKIKNMHSVRIISYNKMVLERSRCRGGRSRLKIT